MCINFVHNHPVQSGETLKFRKPSAVVEKVFKRLLEDGLSPAHALRSFMIHLEFQPADVYLSSIADRTKCPDYNWVHHFYSKLFKKNRETANSLEKVSSLMTFVEQANQEHDQPTCLCRKLDDDNIIVCVITPLMRRGLMNIAAGEIIFVETIGSIDRFGLKLYFLFTEYNVTRIPVGVIIVSVDTQFTIELAFKLFLRMTDGASFGGRGKDGPVVIMTDQLKVELKVLRLVFPKSTLLLDTFHLLRGVYKWLLNSKYHINKDELSHLYSVIRRLVYSKDEESLSRNFSTIVASYTCNPLLISYMKNLYDRRNKWAFCYRTAFLRRDVDRNAVAEREMQVLGERILRRVRLKSPVTLVRFFFYEFDDFYKKKLINKCVDLNHSLLTNECVSEVEARSYTFGPFFDSDCLYYVYNKSKKTKYILNLDVGVCTCYIGVSGNYCKHQQILSDDLNYEPALPYPIIVEPNIELYYIATGSTEVSQSFFDSIQTADVAEADLQYAVEVVLPNEEVTDVDDSYSDEIEQNLNNHVVEEILIEVKEELDLVDEQSAVERQLEAPEIANQLRYNFRVLVSKLRENEPYYREGIASMRKELEKLQHSSAACRLAALHSFRSSVVVGSDHQTDSSCARRS